MAPSILILEEKQIYRELLALLLSEHGFDAIPAANVPMALAYLQTRKISLVLMDMELTDPLGAEFIIRMRQSSPDTQIIILTNQGDKNSVLKAVSMGVRDYMLKASLSSENLIGRIHHMIVAKNEHLHPAPKPAHPAEHPHPPAVAPHAPAPIPQPRPTPPVTDWPRLLSRDQTLLRLDNIAGGKTIAGVVSQVISVASSPVADMADIVRIIQSDPVLASRVLHMANSAATGSRARVHTIEDAARTIGIRGIQNMAISVGIFGTFPPEEKDGFSTMRCWQHSFAVAELMGRIVRQKNPELEGLNHLLGLCHDLGEILLRQYFADEHQQVLDYAIRHHLPIHLVESAALGIRRPELISRLLTKVGLPPNIVDAIRDFHERQIKEHASGVPADASLLQMANLAANGMLLTPTIHEEVRPISRNEWRSLGTDKSPPDISPLVLRNEIILATNVLARLPMHEEQRLLKPLLPHTSLRIGYVRPESFISLDPLAFALQMLADTTIISGMPTVQQLQNIDALVVTGLRLNAPPVLLDELIGIAAAAGLPRLPILAIVGQLDTHIPVAPITAHTYPIHIEHLHQWLLATANALKSAAHPATA